MRKALLQFCRPACSFLQDYGSQRARYGPQLSLRAGQLLSKIREPFQLFVVALFLELLSAKHRREVRRCF
jgi:hypothetical protein